MKARVLVIDNYDSFTYNLVQYLGELGAKVQVRRNDAVSLSDILAMKPTHIVISPGPCTPKEAGISNDVIRTFSGRLPILGVCLGHQCLGYVFGGKVVRAGRIMHGKTSEILHNRRGLFRGLPHPFRATRYHSLLVERASCPKVLEITAWTEQGEIMGLAHRTHLTWGVQFHPESILTQGGKTLLANFLALSPRSRKARVVKSRA